MRLLGLALIMLLMGGAIGALLFAVGSFAWWRALQEGVGGVLGELRVTLGRWDMVDVERQVLRLVQRGAHATLERACLWNRVEVALAPADLSRFAALVPQAEREIAQRIRALDGRPVPRAEERYAVLGPVEVRFVRAGEVGPGTVRVSGAIAAGGSRAGSGDPDPTPLVTRPPAAGTRRQASPWVLGVAGRPVALRGMMVVGSGDDCDVVVSDRRVSKRHARLRVADGAVVLEELGSANGTRVNGRPVSGVRRLASGDLVSFGGAPACRLVDDSETVPA